MQGSGGIWSIIILVAIIALIVLAVKQFNKWKRKNNPIEVDDSSDYFFISNKYALGILGGITGFFLSIIFQEIGIRSMGLSDYIKHLSELNRDNDISLNIIFSVILFAVIGALIGYLIDTIKQNKS